MTKLKISLKPDACIGCALCNKVCPEVFGMEEAIGIAKIFLPEADAACARTAEESCPVGCIYVE